MSWNPDPIDSLTVNTIRTLAIDAIEKARSGHPGLPLGAAPMAYVLWQRHLRFNPLDPAWPDRDRFVLSAGHGSMLQYALLHLAGFDLTLDDLRSFRQWGSRTPGHPEYLRTPGVEATTGPLGQGTAVAVGMAIAERVLAKRFNRPGHTVVDHFTYALVSDGDLMEGISAEAASLAGHLKLGKLIYLYDSNQVSLDGPTSVAFTEDTAARYRAYGWQVLEVPDGDRGLVGIDAAILAARAETDRPSLIIVRTTLGFGSPQKQGKCDAHGAPLGKEEAALTKQALGFDPAWDFVVPEQAAARMQEAGARGSRAHWEWMARWDAWKSEFPELAALWDQCFNARPSPGWDKAIPSWNSADKLATRESSGKVLNALASALPWLFGADADIRSSTKGRIDQGGDIEPHHFEGRNLRCGVREHAMGAICNGLAYHGGLRPFATTFLAFADYMRPSIRMAALDRLPVIYLFTHDSLAVGEDGPTHQPVEAVAALRTIPNLVVLRPADANETAAAWRWTAAKRKDPVALILTRQKVPTLEETAERAIQGVARGAYILAEAPGGPPQALIIASGSEVQLALAARKALAEEGLRIRVISMPSPELFAQQDQVYRDAVLPPSITARVSIEAGQTMGWHRWVGPSGAVLGVERFGASAPGEVAMERYGFTVENLVETVRQVLPSPVRP